jgi:hypothetical protein
MALQPEDPDSLEEAEELEDAEGLDDARNLFAVGWDNMAIACMGCPVKAWARSHRSWRAGAIVKGWAPNHAHGPMP